MRYGFAAATSGNPGRCVTLLTSYATPGYNATISPGSTLPRTNSPRPLPAPAVDLWIAHAKPSRIVISFAIASRDDVVTGSHTTAFAW